MFIRIYVYLCAQFQLLCSLAPFCILYICMYVYIHAYMYVYISNIVTQVRLAPSSCLIFNFISRPLHNQRHFERNESKIKLKMTHPQRSWPSRVCVCACASVCARSKAITKQTKNTLSKNIWLFCAHLSRLTTFGWLVRQNINYGTSPQQQSQQVNMEWESHTSRCE